MASIPKSQAQTEAEAAQAALEATAAQLFIDAADAQIQEAIDQGKYFVNCLTHDENVDPKTIFDYYTNLGYGVSFPDYPQNLALQPAQLFGEFWINYWQNNLVPRVKKYPLRFLISWKP